MIPNGLYTFTNLKDEHRTFQIKTQKPDAKFAPGKRIAALLTGSDNEKNYTGFGFIETNDTVTVWNSRNYPKSPFKYYAKMIEAAGKVVDCEKEVTETTVALDNGHIYKLLASRRCMVCNRTLTDPESIKTGIGPVCRAA